MDKLNGLADDTKWNGGWYQPIEFPDGTKTISTKDKIKILILTDGLGWIVDRITDEMIDKIPYEFTKVNYTNISKEEFVKLANQHDIVHFQNWDIKDQLDVLGKVKVPILITIRSHRYPEYIKGLEYYYHVITPELKEIFPQATYIPDGVFELTHRPFTVGFAGRPVEYKGFHLIKQACEEIGVIFKPTENLPFSKMGEYYESIDLYVCASENEGHSTPVMECLSINKPVITTNVGIPKSMDVYKVERSVEGIKKGILKYYTQNQIEKYSWKNICNQFSILYEEIKHRRWTNKDKRLY